MSRSTVDLPITIKVRNSFFNTMKFLKYTIEDFAEDECFIEWIKNPSAEKDFFWNAFISSYPEKLPAIEQARNLVLEISQGDIDIQEDDIHLLKFNILSAIAGEKEFVPVKDIREVKTKYFPTLMKIAAGLTVILIATFLLFINFKKPVSVGISLEERVNPNGQRSSIILPDGSKVWLNAGSKLKYYSNLNESKNREVFLEGEAFFEVAKNKNRPFLVHANAILIKVLGTSFNVKSYLEDNTVETTLVEGRVAINEEEQNIVLKPNQKAVFSKSKGDIELFEVDPSNSICWKDGKLIFHDETLEQVAKKLERWYGVKMEVKSGKSCRFNLKIGKETLKEVLENFKVISNLSYETIENRIIIDLPNCS
jgi:transmembrane sensor